MWCKVKIVILSHAAKWRIIPITIISTQQLQELINDVLQEMWNGEFHLLEQCFCFLVVIATVTHVFMLLTSLIYVNVAP